MVFCLFKMLLNVLGGFEISRDNTLIAQFRAHICNGNELTSKICAIFDFVLAGFGWSQFNSVSDCQFVLFVFRL